MVSAAAAAVAGAHMGSDKGCRYFREEVGAGRGHSRFLLTMEGPFEQVMLTALVHTGYWVARLQEEHCTAKGHEGSVAVEEWAMMMVVGCTHLYPPEIGLVVAAADKY